LSRFLRGFLLFSLFLAVLAAIPGPAAAEADISITGYRTEDGSFYPTEDGGTIPVGAQLQIRVWVDLYACDPVTVDWGDGVEQSVNYGGTFALTWPHTYNEAGTYLIQATDACASSWSTATINVGLGGFAIFDPANELFIPTLLAVVLGIAALAQTGAKPRATAGGTKPALFPRGTWTPGVPPSMAAHRVSYRDIPIGAPLQPDPRIGMVPGEATDVFQEMHCKCGGRLGYVAGGWFCLNAQCPKIQTPAT
jgi:hypothetical protein